jgi:hypothetical protein
MQITLQSRIKLQTGNNWKLTQRVKRINKEIMQKETLLQDNRKLSMTEGGNHNVMESIFRLFFAAYRMVTDALCCSNLYYQYRQSIDYTIINLLVVIS